MKGRTSYPTTVPHGLMFHHFYGGWHPKVQGSISHKEFEEILEFVGPGRLLSPEDWLEKVQKGRLGNGDLCITFDDALLCQFEIALPVLEKLGIKAFWFIYSSVFEGHLEKMEVYRLFRCKFFSDIREFYDLFLEKVFASRYAQAVEEAEKSDEIEEMLQTFPFYSIQDIRFRIIRDRVLPPADYERMMDEMICDHGLTLEVLSQNLWLNDDHLRYLTKQGHVVGLHSYSHPTTLGLLPYGTQHEEYLRNYRHIQAVCGRAPRAAAYPANSYNEDTLCILSDFGIMCAFRSNMVASDRHGRINPNDMELAREDHTNILRMVSGAKAAMTDLFLQPGKSDSWR